MRQILSISFPATDVRQIKKIAQQRGHSSVSSYVNYLFKSDENLILEAELLKSARIARKEYRAHKSIKAKSLADLI